MEVHVLSGDVGRRGDEERRGLVADLANGEVQHARRGRDAIATRIVGDRGDPRPDDADDQQSAPRRAATLVWEREQTLVALARRRTRRDAGTRAPARGPVSPAR